MTQRILITGSSGYIGGHLTGHLSSVPDTEVFGFNRNLDAKLPPTHCLCGDLMETDMLGWISQVQPDVIYHCVGINPKAPFEHQLRVNAEGTRRLLQAVVDNAIRPRIIVVGSAAEYGLQDKPVDENTLCQPEGEYGIAKLAQTQFAQSFARRHDLPVVIGRVFNAYGHTARHLAVAALAAQIVEAETRLPMPAQVHVYNLKSSRDFIHVDDVVRGLVALGTMPAPKTLHGQIYNIGSGRSTALSDILDLLLSHATLTPAQRQQVQFIMHGAQQEDKSWASIDKIQQHTGWQPQVELNIGLKQELDYWREQIAEAGLPVKSRT